MKNRLMFLALAVVCYGNMQAEGWFANQWNRIDTTLKNYIPGPYSSLHKLSPENAASRIAFMKHAYNDKPCKHVLTEDYVTNLKDQERALDQKHNNFLKYYDSVVAANNPKKQYYQDKQYRDAIYEHIQAVHALRKQQENFIPLIQQHEQEYAKPWSFWQYQHPDRFEY